MENNKSKIPPPTPEQWERLPWYFQDKIFIYFFWHVFVIRGLARLGLWLGGIKLPKNL